MEIVEILPPVASALRSNGPIASGGNGERWIDVDLTNQTRVCL